MKLILSIETEVISINKYKALKEISHQNGLTAIKLKGG